MIVYKPVELDAKAKMVTGWIIMEQVGSPQKFYVYACVPEYLVDKIEDKKPL